MAAVSRATLIQKQMEEEMKRRAAGNLPDQPTVATPRPAPKALDFSARSAYSSEDSGK